jgi:hypothetical protein
MGRVTHHFLIRLRIHKEEIFVRLARHSPAREFVLELFLVGRINLGKQQYNITYARLSWQYAIGEAMVADPLPL